MIDTATPLTFASPLDSTMGRDDRQGKTV